jgi:hypothetical protein
MTTTHGRGAPSGQSGPPSSAAVGRLRLVVARLYRQMAQASGNDLNLTYAQLSALARVQEYGPLRLGELAAREQVPAPTLTRWRRPACSARRPIPPTAGRCWSASPPTARTCWPGSAASAPNCWPAGWPGSPPSRPRR